MYPGKPVKIIEIDEDGRPFKLNEPVLHEILREIPDELPVAVISVVGEYRTGKSFLLNVILKYLYEAKNHGEQDPRRFQFTLEHHDFSKWFAASMAGPDGAVEWKFSDDNHVGKNMSTGFTGKRENFPRAKGIWMWNEWFEMDLPAAGQKAAVLIVDTQGLHDANTNNYLVSLTLGISFFLSSYTIYNVQNKINQHHVDDVSFYSAYGKLPGKANEKSGFVKFQNLDFLVRDFPYFNQNPASWGEDMEDHLAVHLGTSPDYYLNKIRKQLWNSFEDISCYCLPYPGRDVAVSNKYDGGLLVVESDFLSLLSGFVNQIFMKRLGVKQFQGKPVYAPNLSEYIKDCFHSIEKANYTHHVKSFFETNEGIRNMYAMIQGESRYRCKMDGRLGSGDNYVSAEKLADIHEDAFATAIRVFDNLSFGSEDAVEGAKGMLNRELSTFFAMYKEINSLKQKTGCRLDYLPVRAMRIDDDSIYSDESVRSDDDF